MCAVAGVDCTLGRLLLLLFDCRSLLARTRAQSQRLRRWCPPAASLWSRVSTSRWARWLLFLFGYRGVGAGRWGLAFAEGGRGGGSAGPGE